jgi:hypothetical protein
MKRKKRLKKQEQGLLMQIKKHQKKLKTEKGKKDTTHDYWLKEIERFKQRAKERTKKLQELHKKKKLKEK